MGPSITPYTRKLARKSHCKSRLGCQNCKRRRVKHLIGCSSRAQQELCRLGFTHHYVLRLLLAFAGFHIVQTLGDLSNSPYLGMSTDFYTEAEHHLNLAVREVSTLVTQIQPNNSASLYVSTIFIFLSSLVKGPQTGEYMAFRDDGNPGHLSLFLGVPSILELCQTDIHPSVFAIHGGEEEQQHPSPETPLNTNTQHNPETPTHYEDHLAAFRELLSTLIPTSDPRASSYQQSLNQLHFSLHAVLGPLGLGCRFSRWSLLGCIDFRMRLSMICNEESHLLLSSLPSLPCC
ncbi:hypothetical protein F9C07_7428 [Aspergillus flavus]|uniref:Zn(2)-C6 fungal-type domain-containing protein n=2 Tax=Aspergillus subgen. Circumdati TaxID=2720871 RepID=A0A7U2MMT3_ASPFN|nr:hypothetical protein F9C07_7428 [Aspergillus flavus]